MAHDDDAGDDILHLHPVDDIAVIDDFDTWLSKYYRDGSDHRPVIFDESIDTSDLGSYCEHEEHDGVSAVICAARTELIDHLYDVVCSSFNL